MNNFFDTAEFKAAYEHIQAKDLEASVKNAVEKYVLDGAAHLHKWKPTAKNKLDKTESFISPT